MGFFDDLAKNAALWGAVEASKDANGKPDPYKAAGIAAGMGNFSLSDRAKLGAMLGSQGAFNDDDYYGGSYDDDDDDDDCVLFCEDELDDGIDSDDNDTEEENEGTVELTIEISTPKHKKPQGSVNSYAARRERYTWRKSYRRENTYGLNVYEYETEREFLRALAVAKKKYMEVARNDKNIYIYCGVTYENNPYPYHYRTNDTTIKVGDKVVVPVGPHNKEKIAEIVSVERHTRLTVPYPVEKVKFILRKYEE